jgi:redox-sensitive bicupin YhaK (pirin superfamily)
VHLKRAFGFHDVPSFDPFLLLDDFHSDNPEDYIRGFPWHPHRGIETITYVLRGDVEHGDSMGNTGVISTGDVQWMTAGSGIIHQEMPKGDRERVLQGFQLWANLPAESKMMPPRYREVKNEEIPEVSLDGGVRVRIISGELAGVAGPVRDIVIAPEFLDVAIPPGTAHKHPIGRGRTVFAYVIEGRARFEPEDVPRADETPGRSDSTEDALVDTESLILFGDGDEITVSAQGEGVRFLLISGNPIGEPIAWRGPIVMNTDEELATAFDEYHRGAFLKRSES